MELLQPGFARTPLHKAMINIGAGFDIPTGVFLEGANGEFILNGGVANITGVAGKGNTYKSTLSDFMMFTAMLRISMESTGSKYDTELNQHIHRLRKIVDNLRAWMGSDADLFDTGRFVLTDKAHHTGDEWYDLLRTFLTDTKKKAMKALLRNTPFLDHNGELMQIPVPTFTSVDSFSQFISQNAMKLQEENAIGSSETNMLNMQQGRAKAQFLMDIPALAQAVYNYVFLTVHIGDEFNMDPRAPKPKQNQYMKQGQKIKGAPEGFMFLTNNCWMSSGTSLMIADNDMGPQYPRDSDDKLKKDTDLNEVTVTLLRGKSGQSGLPHQVVISQHDGVQPTLTEFHNMRQIKESGDKRWGFNGNNVNYELDLLPGVKLSRTAIRGKIDEQVELRRAINISSELCQMAHLWHHVDDYIMTPGELHAKIIEQGYDWGMILGQTREWWTIDNASPKHDKMFLSSFDLLRMAKNEYVPYWLEPNDRKAIRKEYQKG